MREVSKEEFKKCYFKYRTEGDGWSDEYWEKNFEGDEGRKFYVKEPESESHSRMLINTSDESVELFLMTEESEESFFWFPE